jgi:hypothetical protein
MRLSLILALPDSSPGAMLTSVPSQAALHMQAGMLYLAGAQSVFNTLETHQLIYLMCLEESDSTLVFLIASASYYFHLARQKILQKMIYQL